MNELQEIFNGVLNRWCPDVFSDEDLNIRMIRALLNLNALEMDYKRVENGENPIRNDYPLKFPK